MISYQRFFLATGCFVCLSLAQPLFAQDTPQDEEYGDIQPDRPGWGESTVVIPRHTVQLEAGFTYYNTSTDSFKIENYNYINALARVGLTKEFEIRFGLGGYNLTKETSKYNSSFSDKYHGYQPLQLGFKSKLVKGEGPKLQMAFEGMVILPWVGYKGYRPQTLSPFGIFCFSHEFADRFLLGYNVGMFWNRDMVGTMEAEWFYTLSLDANIVGGLGGFIEAYSWVDQDFKKADVGINGGFVYVLDKLQFDLSGGYTYVPGAPWWFLMAGVSYRFPK